MSDVGKPVLSPYRWVILAVSMLAGFIGSYAQFQLPPLAYKLMPALDISQSQFAALMGGPMTGSIFVCILGGALADRFGVKKVVAVGLVLAVIGCTFRYAVTSFWPFLFLTILAGLASGLLISNLAKLFGAWFPPEQMGTIIGICLISPALAMFAGTATTALFPSDASAFIFSGIVCLIILILWLIFAKNKPEGAPELPMLPATQYLGKAARSRSIWLAGLCMFFVMGAIMTFSDFLPKVLRDLSGISPVQAGFYGSMATLGGVFGCFMGPVICNRMGVMKRYLIIVVFWRSGQLLVLATFGWSVDRHWYDPGRLSANAIMPLLLSLPMLLPEIGPCTPAARGHHRTLQVTALSSSQPLLSRRWQARMLNVLFGLAALCMALIVIPVFFLPELGSRALAARAGKVSAKQEN